jgi:hypothetical protein
MSVVVLGIFGEERLELVPVPDEGAVEEFVADGADPAFGIGVRPGSPRRGW